MNVHFQLMQKLLQVIGINVETLDDLFGRTVERDILLQSEIIQIYFKMIPELKSEYYSDMLSCLHKNSLKKQRFPAICMLRQMCKTNGVILTPKAISMGYDKSSGKKLVKRLFIFQPDLQVMPPEAEESL